MASLRATQERTLLSISYGQTPATAERAVRVV